MKKTVKMLACALIVIPFLTGCSFSGEDFQQKEYTADSAQVQGIQIDVKDRNIVVELSDSEQISIVYSESEKEAYDFSLSADKTLLMTYRNNKEWIDYIGGKSPEEARTIRLQIPADALDSLEIITSNEDVSLPTLALAKKLSLNVNNGNIRFEKLDVGSDIDLKVKNGDISGIILGGYDDFTITSSVKKGKSNLPEQAGNGEKRLKAAANNGDISIEFEK